MPGHYSDKDKPKKGKKKVEKVMSEYKSGALKSSSGKKKRKK